MPVNPTHSIDKSVLILGGAGLVGAQIAHQVARDLRPEKIVIASLYQKEVREVVHELKKLFRGRATYAWSDDGTLFATWQRER